MSAKCPQKSLIRTRGACSAANSLTFLEELATNIAQREPQAHLEHFRIDRASFSVGPLVFLLGIAPMGNPDMSALERRKGRARPAQSNRRRPLPAQVRW